MANPNIVNLKEFHKGHKLSYHGTYDGMFVVCEDCRIVAKCRDVGVWIEAADAYLTPEESFLKGTNASVGVPQPDHLNEHRQQELLHMAFPQMR